MRPTTTTTTSPPPCANLATAEWCAEKMRLGKWPACSKSNVEPVCQLACGYCSLPSTPEASAPSAEPVPSPPESRAGPSRRRTTTTTTTAPNATNATNASNSAAPVASTTTTTTTTATTSVAPNASEVASACAGVLARSAFVRIDPSADCCRFKGTDLEVVQPTANATVAPVDCERPCLANPECQFFSHSADRGCFLCSACSLTREGAGASYSSWARVDCNVSEAPAEVLVLAPAPAPVAVPPTPSGSPLWLVLGLSALGLIAVAACLARGKQETPPRHALRNSFRKARAALRELLTVQGVARYEVGDRSRDDLWSTLDGALRRWPLRKADVARGPRAVEAAAAQRGMGVPGRRADEQLHALRHARHEAWPDDNAHQPRHNQPRHGQPRHADGHVRRGEVAHGQEGARVARHGEAAHAPLRGEAGARAARHGEAGHAPRPLERPWMARPDPVRQEGHDRGVLGGPSGWHAARSQGALWPPGMGPQVPVRAHRPR